MLRLLKNHIPTLVTAAVAIGFFVAGRVSLTTARRSIDGDLLLVLFALLVAVDLLRVSGALDLAVARTVSRIHTTRTFVLGLIALTGLLSALVTNDVSLFVVIPFTIAASRFSCFDVEVAVILEIVAANLLGCLTPIGNPQNLFVFHQSAWSAGRFVMTMLPFVAMSAVGLLLAAFLCVKNEPLRSGDVAPPPRHVPTALAGLLTFLLVLLEIARVLNAWPAAIVALLAAALFLRRRIVEIDFSIVPLFFFAFIVVDGLQTFDIARFIGRPYVTSIVLSQFISNVPATVLLRPFIHGHWRELLYGVSAGGCGTIIASLANLLGWRIYVRESNRDPRFFWRLTVFSCAFLGWTAIGGWTLLR